ncbi:unnamed protein product [Caenorhabditis angaria]|uniref:Aminopeptidase N-like N-terminal domain-containing protein n=1 Tax=Caenorhabditis angaria TaxID=860376 RepID=A0A9P1J339_9PELO|nr:unnamed protein product [Caenorhabditis angaria]
MKINHFLNLHINFCTCRFLITWFLLTFSACLIYAIVVFGSLVNRKILPTNNVPKTIPYITVPSEYDVFLEFFGSSSLINKTYTGSLQMTFEAKDLTQRLFFHRGPDIRILNITLEDSNGTKSTPSAGAYDKNTDVQAYIPISNLTKETTYKLEIGFEGTIGENPNGPLDLPYTSENNENKHSMVFGHSTTASSGLRFLMPCLDSQDFPALFNFNIRHPPDFRVISNFVGNVQQSPLYTTTIFNATFQTFSSSIVLALIDMNLTSQSIKQEDIMINKYFRKNVINTVSTDRVLQFMASKTSNIGKLDVLCLPQLSTINQAGISFLNEEDVQRENFDLGINNFKN